MTREDNAGRLPQLEAQIVRTIQHQAGMVTAATPFREHDGRVADDQDFADVEADALHGATVQKFEKFRNIRQLI